MPQVPHNDTWGKGGVPIAVAISSSKPNYQTRMDDQPTQPRRMTITRLAKLAGVSPTTVSHVLNGRTQTRVKPDTRDRILDLARTHSYRPSLVARSLLLKRSGLVACVLPDITSSIAIRLAKGIEAGLREADYSLVLAHSDYDLETEKHLVHNLASRGMDAIFVGCVSHTDDHLRTLQQRGYPLIRLDDKPERDAYNFITYDDCAGFRIAVDYLVKLGHREIGYISGVPHSPTNDDRFRGYQEGMRAAELKPRPDWHLTAGFLKEDGRRAADEFLKLKDRPTAVVVFNDNVGIGLMQVLRENGLRIPQDLSIVGFDDTDLAADPAYNLTTLRLPEQPWADQLVSLALRLIDSNSAVEQATGVVLAPHLIERNSAAPATR